MSKFTRSKAQRSTYALESLEPRALLSVAPFMHGGDGDSQGDNDNNGGDEGGHHGGVHVSHMPTPIADLTGNPLTLSEVVGLPAVQMPSNGDSLSDMNKLFLPAVQRLMPFDTRFLPAVQDIATISSSVMPVNLRGYSVSIDWGDGTPPTRGFLVVDKTGLIHVKGFHSYSSVGTFTVNITVTQNIPATSTTTASTATLTIASTANVTQNSDTGLTITPTTGQPFSGVVGNFSLTASTDPTSFTALVFWGDRSRSLGTVALNTDGTFSVSGDHTYSAAGTYRITIVVFENPPAGLTHANPNNHGLHLGWEHSFVTTIFSTATVTDAVVTPPGTTG